MKFVSQTNLQQGSGNCFAACIASLLEMSLADLPEFSAEPDPMSRARAWLASLGVRLIPLPFSEAHKWLSEGDVFIVSGMGLSGRTRHAVIGQYRRGYIEMIFDPYPGEKGLYGTPEGVYLLVRLIGNDANVQQVRDGSERCQVRKC